MTNLKQEGVERRVFERRRCDNGVGPAIQKKDHTVRTRATIDPRLKIEADIQNRGPALRQVQVQPPASARACLPISFVKHEHGEISIRANQATDATPRESDAKGACKVHRNNELNHNCFAISELRDGWRSGP